MTARKARIAGILIALAFTAALSTLGCGPPPLELQAEEARSLIVEEWTNTDPTIVSTRVEGERGFAETEFNGALVTFIFLSGEEGWRLDSVEHEGRTYAIKDLAQISETMVLMDELARALARYKADHGIYPIGDGPQAGEVMVPDYLPADTVADDAWGNRLTYLSEDGSDYTLVSYGPDQEAGTQDDLVLVSGEFVDPGESQVPM